MSFRLPLAVVGRIVALLLFEVLPAAFSDQCSAFFDLAQPKALGVSRILAVFLLEEAAVLVDTWALCCALVLALPPVLALPFVAVRALHLLVIPSTRLVSDAVTATTALRAYCWDVGRFRRWGSGCTRGQGR